MEANSASDALDRQATRIPDVMNDPEYDTNATAGQDDGEADVDTCRICRGEATEQEPLFYPCKCSGSIKFVHQDCLLEWLSHSQKKHCELCKTPFRFTKLYSPNMPSDLPFYVFMKHLIVQSIQNVATWLRFCLVVVVWLVCLPWAMRHVWTFLFWFGDGGWSNKQINSNTSHLAAAKQAVALAQKRLASLAATGTSPAHPLLAKPTSSATTWTVFEKLSDFLKPVSQTLNMSTPEPLAASFLKSVAKGLGFHNGSSAIGPARTANISSSILSDMQEFKATEHTSLLSDSKFLNGLTRNPRLNNVIITTLEGQIITIVVVVCFVLVFLIREWVVQQQPGINMGAGFNAEFAGGERAERLERNRVAALENIPDPERLPLNQTNLGREHDDVAPEAIDVVARPIARPRRRIVRFDEAEADDFGTRSAPPFSRADTAVSNLDEAAEKVGEPSNSVPPNSRPTIPMRDALAPAVEVQRQLTENFPPNQGRIGAGEFVTIWRRAGGDPDEILRIMDAENLGDRLRYWKNAMKSLQTANSSSIRSPDVSVSMNGTSQYDNTLNTETPLTEAALLGYEAEAEASSSSQSQAAAHNAYPISRLQVTDIPSSGKGKEKLVELTSEPLFDSGINKSPDAKPLKSQNSLLDGDGMADPKIMADQVATEYLTFGRPRAISEGPQLRDSISPLANNNWSFSDLPAAPVTFGGLNGASHVTKDQLWKISQDLRVQEAVLKGREAHARRSSGLSITSAAGISPTQQQNVDVPLVGQTNDKTVIPKSQDEVSTRNQLSESEGVQEEIFPTSGNTERAALQRGDDSPVDVPLLPQPALEAAQREIPQGILGHIADWLWGDMVPRQDRLVADDEHVVEDFAAEAPFVPVAHHHGPAIFGNDNGDGVDEIVPDRDEADAAIAAGLDPNDLDGLDDIEDFDGIMELVGMRGPLTGLIQNGLFSAVLISLTVACGVWIPYNLGRLTLLLVAYPINAIKLPLKLLFGMAVILQDLTLIIVGGSTCLLIELISLPRYFYIYFNSGLDLLAADIRTKISIDCMNMSVAAGFRIAHGIVGTLVQIPESEVPAFSAVSHEALLHIKSTLLFIVESIGAFITSQLAPHLGGPISVVSSATISSIWSKAITIIGRTIRGWPALSALLGNPTIWVVSLDSPARSSPLDLSLSYWSGTDRFWAVLAGYVSLTLLGAAYLKRGTPFSTSQNAKEWEATIIDILNQAGGVMKVILIISIEMLVFPLYCGLLLDLALLPLFENATVVSRVHFTIHSPFTSIFVHWFVGTCYMFHFALFVSMCRKIMRGGVLYFIRDPDDPTFHPVRDVLERNVGTQLRKITFSAMVYGALVVLCLGGVVWTLAVTFESVLPIRWSSNEPVLEFPIDLLFYNFFMPLAVKVFKPSDGLHAVYAWWFRKCARVLRLTWFLFDERMKDEEGHHVRNSWADYVLGRRGDTIHPVSAPHALDEKSEVDPYFCRDGMYVRAPASDQVRIPKGGPVFLEVDENNNTRAGVADHDEGLHGRNNELFKMVYIPPYFRWRVFLFMLYIWLFAAGTGVCVTIVPLVVGRRVFSMLIPAHVQTNDVYAFSIGIYILGGMIYCLWHIRDGLEILKKTMAVNAQTPTNILRHVLTTGLWILKLIYAYAAFALVLPILFSLVVEFYFILPIDSYFFPSEPHVIHVVQSWTLGLLYVKLASRFILWYADSRPAEALRAVTRNGYFDPDVRIATRCFILPATVLFTTALVLPLGLAWISNKYEVFGSSDSERTATYQYAYPMTLSLAINLFGLWSMIGILKGWRMKIRDEVYLVGERLHNFGDRTKSGSGSLIHSASRIET